MAEALLRAKLRNTKAAIDNTQQFSVSSAGLAALVGQPASTFAQELMLEKGLDISKHRARQATPEILFAADLIFTMTTGQQEEIECNLPSICGRIHRLGKWGGYEICDPYLRPKKAYEQSLILIEQGIEDWFKKLWN